MRVLQINTVYKNGGSTGRIVYDLKALMERKGIESYVAFGYEYSPTNDKNTYRMATIPETKFSILQTRIDGKHGFYNLRQTKKLLSWIDSIKPDLIHLHNLHCHYINVEILFNYIKKNNIPIIWTLHDCWSFTGWCAHFDYVGCGKWKDHCCKCENLREYPFTWFFDRSSENYTRKKNCFQGVSNLRIVTPSVWLASLVKQSFLKEYPVSVINNGIDLNVFTPKKSNIKEKIGVGKRRMILAMAMGMSKLKGYDDIIKLNETLDHDKHCIVMVGMKRKQIKELPIGIIGLERTEDVNRLIELYSAADVFINPTLQDTFPTTNLEAQACGTPVITYETGGSPESIKEGCGIIVEKGNIEELRDAVNMVFTTYSSLNDELCIENARQNYNKDKNFEHYIALYENINSNRW